MKAERWRRIEELFQARPSAGASESWLARLALEAPGAISRRSGIVCDGQLCLRPTS